MYSDIRDKYCHQCFLNVSYAVIFFYSQSLERLHISCVSHKTVQKGSYITNLVGFPVLDSTKRENISIENTRSIKASLERRRKSKKCQSLIGSIIYLRISIEHVVLIYHHCM